MYTSARQLLIGTNHLKIDIHEQEFLQGSADKKILDKVSKGSIIIKVGRVFR